MTQMGECVEQPGKRVASFERRLHAGRAGAPERMTHDRAATRPAGEPHAEADVRRQGLVPVARGRVVRSRRLEDRARDGAVPEARKVVAEGDVEGDLAEPARVQVDRPVSARRVVDQYLELEDARPEDLPDRVDRRST